MKSIQTLISLAVVALGSLTVFNAGATVHYVNPNNPAPVPPYTSWATAATNIQAAVNAASGGDTVLVTNGVYQTGTTEADGENRVAINNQVNLRSVNGPTVTVIVGAWDAKTNGPNAVRCVYLNQGATLSGFILTNGATVAVGTELGGGVFCNSSGCVVSNCVITGNAAFSEGGGAYGGILINCTLSGNLAATGGGAYACAMTNCVVTGNQASTAGGGLYGGKTANCTVVSNSAPVGSGVDDGNFDNCIIYYNFPANIYPPTSSMAYCCTISPGQGMGNITNAPVFVNPGGGDFHLSANSPCINSGNNADINFPTDRDGNSRIVGGTVDLGAYEFQSPLRFVNVSNLTPVSPYTNWVTAATNIQAAINAANAGDYIVVTDGVYSAGGQTIYGISNRVAVNKAVTVASVNGPGSTLIGGPKVNGPGIRCAYLTNGAVLIGFTLTNGTADTSGDLINEQSGGCAWCEPGSAAISNCVLTAGYANEYGGGVVRGILNNCTLLGNTAFIAGGGAWQSTLNNCLVNSNRLIQGFGGGGISGGIANNTLITSNTAFSGGGACAATLNNCVLYRNFAQESGGGGISNVMNNCLIVLNTADGGGAGVARSVLNDCILATNNAANSDGGGALGGSLVNCTIIGNSAVAGGGAADGAVLENCIVYDNSNFSITPNYTTDCTLNYCCTVPLPGSQGNPTNPPDGGMGNITNDPGLVNPAAGNFQLQSNSPCINSGDNAYVTNATDYAGDPRVIGGTVDVGAYEYQTPGSVISYAWLQQYGLPTDGSVDDGDADGTGMSNRQKWIAGLNPTNPASVLVMLPPAVTSGSAGITVTWQSVNTRRYYLLRAANLGGATGFSMIQSNLVGQAGTTSYLDQTATGNGPYFYRVAVQ